MSDSNPPPGSILIVEDHSLTASFLTELLGGAFPGRALHLADSARLGISTFVQFAPSLVVMDIGLPDGSGLELTRRMAGLDEKAMVVIYSTDDSEVMKQGAAAAGARAFVSKNNPRELVQVIGSLLVGAP